MTPPRTPQDTASPARATALRVLLDVEASRADSAERLDLEIRERGLSDVDARLATALVYTVLRNRTLLDHQVAPFLRLAPSRLEPAVREILRLAAAQRWFFERIPPHAIANDSVTLARRVVRLHRREHGFVNAVVRRILDAPELRLPDQGSRDEVLSIRYSVPAWILGELRGSFGEEKAAAAEERLEALLAAVNSEPPAALRVNVLATGVDVALAALAEAGIHAGRSRVVPEGIVLQEPGTLSRVIALPLFAAGHLYVQDEASQMVAHVARPAAGERILDYCSAPGGKTTHLAELSGGQALITATDASAERLATVGENIARMRTPGVTVLPMEQVEAGVDGGFDLVLVDAPCSGLGTIRRHPEVRWRRSPETVRQSAVVQGGVLRAAARHVKSGGRLIYSTCSVTRAENADVVRAFCDSHPGFAIDRTPNPVAAVESLRWRDGFMRTWPQLPDVDGFEAVVLRRLDA